ncbi:hypothetical protein U5801_18875 [Lamprobacter modestohalophilus]|uniref:hypothetical protein n=1 Tax=Lamprobacter modestohalophilus TaxID=1064514 RepID=UPI002ADEE9B5|nr:hypothetical protein [Lamprobacter modestohalophilus]MEA1051852.1 hypothetical protein [Lamprobacter modestohalophilus]
MSALLNHLLPFRRAEARASGRPPVLLVIGAHREELSFGEAVAAQLDRQRIDLLRIPVGISGQRPGPDALEGYRQRHAELYRQILEHVQPEQRVLIDLHTGFDERLCSADVLCGEPALLRCIEHQATESGAAGGGGMRAVRLLASEPDVVPSHGAHPQAASWPWVRPVLPEAIWNSRRPLYVGVEVYLASSSCASSACGTPAEVRFAAAVIEAVGDCALSVQRAMAPG